jgi:hypothetical protein
MVRPSLPGSNRPAQYEVRGWVNCRHHVTLSLLGKAPAAAVSQVREVFTRLLGSSGPELIAEEVPRVLSSAGRREVEGWVTTWSSQTQR